MKDWKKKLKQNLTDEEIQRYLRFLAVPFVALILIVVIVVSDRPKRNEQEAEPAVSQSQEVVKVNGGEEDNSQYQMDFSAYELQKDNVPELNELLNRYFQAKKDCDAEALNQVFGGKTPSEALADTQKKLEDEAVYYEDFRNIVCYTKPGPDADTYVVYACYDIKFRNADTLAPAMSVCYAKKNAEGAFYFEEQTTGKEAEYIARMNQTEDVQLLVSQINSSFKAALESDGQLLGVYNILMKRDEEGRESGAEGDGQESQAAESEPESGASGEGGQETEASPKQPEGGQE